MKLLRLLPILLLAGLIASCAQGAGMVPTATPTLEAVPVQPTATQLQTVELPSATATGTATATATLTNTPTLTLVPSNTASPTPSVLFDQAAVTSLSSANNIVSLVMKIPGLLSAYDLVIDAKTFKCQVIDKYPNLLFCSGSSKPRVNTEVPLAFNDPASGQAVYTGQTLIIPAAVPTETPAGYFSCPNRGKNVFCEVECRIYDNSEPCIVASCSDDCGPYYSIHTCPQTGKNTGICDPALDAEMLKKFGLPPRGGQ